MLDEESLFGVATLSGQYTIQHIATGRYITTASGEAPSACTLAPLGLPGQRWAIESRGHCCHIYHYDTRADFAIGVRPNGTLNFATTPSDRELWLVVLKGSNFVLMAGSTGFSVLSSDNPYFIGILRCSQEFALRESFSPELFSALETSAISERKIRTLLFGRSPKTGYLRHEPSGLCLSDKRSLFELRLDGDICMIRPSGAGAAPDQGLGDSASGVSVDDACKWRVYEIPERPGTYSIKTLRAGSSYLRCLHAEGESPEFLTSKDFDPTLSAWRIERAWRRGLRFHQYFQHTEFAQANPVPFGDLPEVTATMWVNTRYGGSPLSYAVQGSSNELMVDIRVDMREGTKEIVVCSRNYKVFEEDLSSTTLVDGDWHFIAITRSASQKTICLWIDGDLVATSSNVSSSPLRGGGRLVVGQEQDPDGFHLQDCFRGSVREIRILRRALDGPELEALMNHTEVCPEADICFEVHEGTMQASKDDLWQHLEASEAED